MRPIRLFLAPLAAALLAPLLAAAPLAAQDALSPAEGAAVDERIRAYLLENPEVILEALEVLEARRQAQAEATDAALTAEHAEALLDDGYSAVLGDPDGDVTIVEFIDYRCGYCKRAHPQTRALLEADGNIRLVVKEFPILGPASLEAARAAMAALRIAPERYKPFHDALMRLRGQLDEAATFRLAEEAGLDPDRLRAAMQSEGDAIAAEIRETYDLARALGIEGTPAFVIGDSILRGLADPERMRALVAEARREG